MRRTTTAWVAGTLGAGLTASIVLAQQLPPSSAPKTGAADAGSSTSAQTPSLYGAAGARGARYLMRNGLDYLNYQQYERALKFLREAEANQKELTAPEIVTLKEGIERARKGLRGLEDQGKTYALSEQTQRRSGFTAARPETAVAQRSNRAMSPVRIPARSNDAVVASADDSPGEPIRLTSAEEPARNLPVRPIDPDSAPAPSTPANLHTPGDEIPALAPPEIPNLTAVPTLEAPGSGSVASPSSSQGVSTVATRTIPQDVAITGTALATDPTPATAGNPQPQPAAIGPKATEPAPVESSTASPSASSPSPAPIRIAPTTGSPSVNSSDTAAAAVKTPTPAPILLETLETPPSEPAPATVSAADKTTATPVATPSPKNPPASGGLVPTAMKGSASSGAAAPSGSGDASPPASSTAPTATEMEAIPLPPLDGGNSASESPAAPSHNEAEPPAALTTPPTSGSDELPPLPGDLARDDAATHPTGGVAPAATSPAPAEPVASPTAAAPTAPHSEEDALPPLPIGVEAPAPLNAAPAPIATKPNATETATPSQESPREPVDLGNTAPTPTPAPAPAQAPAEPTATQPASAEPTPTPTPDTAPPTATAEVASDATPVPVGNTSAPASAIPSTATAPATPNAEPVAKPSAATAPDRMARANPAPVSADINFTIPERAAHVSTLNVELKRKVEEVARNQEKEDELRLHAQQNRPQGDLPPARDNSSSTLQTQTQLDISRAPSPAEARPIKAIPVPEDWVPLAARSWAPQRKYWAAAATCHLPLYFQDPVLERYGHPVEQFVGPLGRYLTYPVDDPRQSTQRNQIVQPFFSAGLFALQIAALPYNLIMDPPWEAQYDLGYYRPGDVIPVDTYWLPLHGYGPPLRGNRY